MNSYIVALVSESAICRRNNGKALGIRGDERLPNGAEWKSPAGRNNILPIEEVDQEPRSPNDDPA